MLKTNSFEWNVLLRPIFDKKNNSLCSEKSFATAVTEPPWTSLTECSLFRCLALFLPIVGRTPLAWQCWLQLVVLIHISRYYGKTFRFVPLTSTMKELVTLCLVLAFRANMEPKTKLVAEHGSSWKPDQLMAISRKDLATLS